MPKRKLYTVEQKLEAVARGDQPEEEPEEPEQYADPEPPKPQLKASDIVVRLQDCEEWLEKQSNADPLQLIHLRNLRSFAQRKTQKSLKDKKNNRFFHVMFCWFFVLLIF